jgi:hypothetical protein
MKRFVMVARFCAVSFACPSAMVSNAEADLFIENNPTTISGRIAATTPPMINFDLKVNFLIIISYHLN